MYYINKIVGWVARPLGVAFIGFAVGWVFNRRGGRLARVGNMRRFRSVQFDIDSWVMGMVEYSRVG